MKGTRPTKSVYEERRDLFAGEERAHERRAGRISNLRLAVFGLGALAALAGFDLEGWRRWSAWALTAVSCVAFVALVAWHERVRRARRRARVGRRINEDALCRLARQWDKLRSPRLAAGEREGFPPFARDLDVFGHASLWKLLGTVSTPLGKATLARWLLDPATPQEVESRQQAVRELAPRLDLRQELELRTRTMDKLEPDCEPFLRWAEGEPWLARRPRLRWTARLLSLLPVPLLALALYGILPHHLWILCALVNLVLTAAVGRHVEAVFSLMSAREGDLTDYSGALELLLGDELPVAGSPRLHALRERWAGAPQVGSEPARAGLAADRQMARLHRLVAMSEVRLSGSLHGVLQALGLWDFHVLDRLEAWQMDAGRRVRGWLDALGETEALCALAGLAFDEPEWCFAEVVEAAPEAGPPRIDARALGHPLIPAPARVGNDVAVGPAGTFLLVTGSNMSGKSTLLRALGLNAVLAQAGGPACAASLRLPALVLGTSILIEDSLEDGVSFFMAELRRIKEVVDLATRSLQRGRTLFYLLDEVLRGTNSFERQTAVRRVLVHLLRAGAIGAVSTHDLELAELDELRPACVPVHFRETLDSGHGRPVMHFDYRLRPGVATTRNALKLLELVGLDLDA